MRLEKYLKNNLHKTFQNEDLPWEKEAWGSSTFQLLNSFWLPLKLMVFLLSLMVTILYICSAITRVSFIRKVKYVMLLSLLSWNLQQYWFPNHLGIGNSVGIAFLDQKTILKIQSEKTFQCLSEEFLLLNNNRNNGSISWEYSFKNKFCGCVERHCGITGDLAESWMYWERQCWLFL